MKISEFPVEEDKIHFLTNGKTVFMKGTELQPFLLQLCGEHCSIKSFNPTYWTNLPDYNNLKEGK